MIRLLVIEDDETIVRMLKEIERLTSNEIAIVTIITELSAVFELTEELSSNRWDIAVVDLNLLTSRTGLMPPSRNYEGVQAITTIQALEPELPIIVLSGNLNMVLAQELLRGGATDVIAKQLIARKGLRWLISRLRKVAAQGERSYA